MIAQHELATLRGTDVYDAHGDRIGSLGQVYLDTTSRQPRWASVGTGLPGRRESLVPISQAERTAGGIRVPYPRSQVADAPTVDASAAEPLTTGEVAELHRHYHLGGPTATDGGRRGSGSDDAMTRSEERLVVDTRREQAGTARLRKYVVTETVQATVPVRWEEARLDREPVTHADRGDARTAPELTEAEYELTLYAERPVVTTETVPVERVRLGKDTVTDQETVTGTVRREEIETDFPGQGRDRLR